MYGEESFDRFFHVLEKEYDMFSLSYFQSNLEGEIVDYLHKIAENDASYGVVMNAGAYTHTSVAIRDAVMAIELPVVEVHISNISARESFRHTSLLTPVCKGCITGFGLESYFLALDYFAHMTAKNYG